MPKAFEKWMDQGGKVRTISRPDGSYLKVWVRPGGAKGPRGGRTISGKVHKKKKG